MSQRVKRSIGVPVCGYFPGGGYSGKTEKLDKAVVKAARLLEKCFSRPVVIRFNFNRKSGGAWIKDDGPGIFNSSNIGLTVSLSADNKLQVNAFVSQDKLTWKELAIFGNDGSRYSYQPCQSLQAGIRWLKKEVKV